MDDKLCVQTALRPSPNPDKPASTISTTTTETATITTYTPTAIVTATTATSIMTTLVPQHFPFLRLPAELRNQIYAILLTDLYYRRRSTFTPRIIRVCRQLHDEAIPFLYSREFRAHPSLLTSFPHYTSEAWPVLSSYYISLIRNWRMWVRLDCDARYTREDVTKAFSGVDSLIIDVYEASYKASGLHLLEKFSGIRGVKCAIVQGTVPDEMAVWLEQAMESDIGKEFPMWKGTEWDVWEDGNR